MQVINLTPHDINIIGETGEVVQTFPASGELARCSVSREQVDVVNGIPVNRTVFGEVTGLPAEQQKGVAYVVSALVAQATKNRDDVLIPDDAVRDEQGKIIGCRAFARV